MNYIEFLLDFCIFLHRLMNMLNIMCCFFINSFVLFQFFFSINYFCILKPFLSNELVPFKKAQFFFFWYLRNFFRKSVYSEINIPSITYSMLLLNEFCLPRKFSIFIDIIYFIMLLWCFPNRSLHTWLMITYSSLNVAVVSYNIIWLVYTHLLLI